MNVIEAIRGRRTIKDFTADPVPPDTLLRVLDAGRWAQNHRLTQPWRFTLLGLEIKEALACAFEDSRAKIVSRPAIVAASCVLSPDEVVRREDYAAAACAIQNVALAAWSEGLGMLWSTGKFTRQPETYRLLGIDPTAEEIVAFLNFGFPATVPPPPPRKGLNEILRIIP